MKLFKTWLVWKLCFLMVFPINVWPQALPVAQPDRVGRAVSGVLQDGMRTRGFAANDPRFGNTLARISPQLSGVVGTAAAITVGAVTAPGWVSVALAIGIGAVITYAVNLGLDALSNWLFRTDGKLDTLGASLNSPAAVSVGGSYWSGSLLVGPGSTNVTIYGGDGRAMAYQSEVNTRKYLGISIDNLSCTLTANSTNTYWSCGSYGSPMYYKSSGAPYSCAYGMYCTATNSFASPTLSSPAKTAISLQTAINDIPASDYEKKLNPAIVAGLANSAWQRAASQPGYDGLPYPQSNPITSAEVSNWTNANPQYAPTVRDFVSPNPTTTASPQPWALPSNPTATTTSPATTPNSNTTNPASANPLQNLGPDPGTGALQLEATPTAQQILQPILSLLPNLRNFSATSHAGACPKPSFSVVGTSITMDAHCTLIDNNKAVMQAAMAFAWAAIALFIILSA